MSECQNPDHDRQALDAVASRLRLMRQGRGLTLAEVAESTGISVSTLSRLESGGRKPTLELLLPLARHYRVPLDDLVGAPPIGDPRVHIRPVRAGETTILPLSHGVVGGAAGEGPGMRVYKQILPGRSGACAPRPQSHPGHEWMYVIAGELRLVLGVGQDAREFRLQPGEAAEFDTRTPHWFDAASPQAVELLALFSEAGERTHVSQL
ncbi:helix-turn-helix domain-containing protein [Zhihengliuella flava]|uniref:Transcriptional regulator with XRE-family HTH domain n=1 Tax=Zhihengliuella flava TaxID=1285193 RepID=A0A931DCI3_9MICC|nr:XRE family transcriptional regulator [Zhihengliuella flava]MBG6084353.1 transcriptional regulator with XRE-family HTH domain [Zhihengliuella flava]